MNKKHLWVRETCSLQINIKLETIFLKFYDIIKILFKILITDNATFDISLECLYMAHTTQDFDIKRIYAVFERYIFKCSVVRSI